MFAQSCKCIQHFTEHLGKPDPQKPREQVQVEVLMAGGAKFREEACRHFTVLQPIDFTPFLTVSAACVAQTIHSTVDNVSSVC